MTTQEQNELARELLPVARRKAVIWAARTGTDPDELESAAGAAIDGALVEYDPDQGLTRRGYATQRITQAIRSRAAEVRAGGRRNRLAAVRFPVDPLTGRELLPADRTCDDPAELVAAMEGLPDPRQVAAAAARQRAAWVESFDPADIHAAAAALKKRAAAGNLSAIKLMHQMTGG